MILNRGMFCLCACTVMAFCPALLAAVRSTACRVEKPTAASNTWNFPQEADQTFAQVLQDARAATRTADRLAMMNQNNQDGMDEFTVDTNLLTQLGNPVDDIGADVCRLESIRRVVAPWQQKTIDSIVSSITVIADNTEDAIQYVNRTPSNLWNPTYQQYLNNVYHEGNHLTKTLKAALKNENVNSSNQEKSTN